MKTILKKSAVLYILSFLLISLVVPVFAHPGSLDENGGHYNRSTGEYHYHHGYSAHQHTNGECPYDFHDNVVHQTGGSSNSTNSSNSSDYSEKESTTELFTDSNTNITIFSLPKEIKEQIKSTLFTFSIIALYILGSLVLLYIGHLVYIKSKKSFNSVSVIHLLRYFLIFFMSKFIQFSFFIPSTYGILYIYNRTEIISAVLPIFFILIFLSITFYTYNILGYYIAIFKNTRVSLYILNLILILFSSVILTVCAWLFNKDYPDFINTRLLFIIYQSVVLAILMLFIAITESRISNGKHIYEIYTKYNYLKNIIPQGSYLDNDFKLVFFDEKHERIDSIYTVFISNTNKKIHRFSSCSHNTFPYYSFMCNNSVYDKMELCYSCWGADSKDDYPELFFPEWYPLYLEFYNLTLHYLISKNQMKDFINKLEKHVYEQIEVV